MLADSKDGSWGSAGYQGFLKIKSIPGVKASLIDRIREASCEDVLRDSAFQGFDLILAHGAEFSDPIVRIARDYPQTWFACVNGSWTAKNLASFSLADEEQGYLVGVLAAKMSRSSQVGFITGLEFASTRQQYLGFKWGAFSQGAQEKGIFTGSFSDPFLARQSAEDLADVGVDVIYYYLKESGREVHAVCRERGLHAIGAITDHTDKARDVLYTCAVQNVGLLHDQAVQLALEGKLEGRRYRLGLSHPDVMGLSPLNAVPENVSQEIEKVRQQIIAGTLKFPTA